jgi:hypothetical protein
MIKAGVRTAMITTRAVPALLPPTACHRSSAPTHRDFAGPLPMQAEAAWPSTPKALSELREPYGHRVEQTSKSAVPRPVQG